VSGPELVELKK
jgi:hypothetical protein